MRKSILFLLLTCGLHTAAALADTCRVILPASVELSGEALQWNGPCEGGYADGIGSLLRILDGKQVGSFQGRMSKGMMSEGYEKMPDGGQYEGHYKDGLREGQGEWVGKNRDNYAGEWRAGQRSGWGVANYSLGGRFEGPWDHDHPSGKGKITYAGGKRLETDVAFPPESTGAVTRLYSLKNPDWAYRAGDTAPQAIAKSSVVPFDKGFAELTLEQQQLVRRVYPLLHSNDIPPYPLHGKVGIFKWLSQAHGEVRTPGLFYAQVDIDLEGKATSVRILESPDKELGNFIATVLLQQKYSPAQCNGAPCAMRFPFEVMLTTD